MILPSIPPGARKVPTLESMIMIHAGLVMDLFAIDAATISSDFDEARFLTMVLAQNADSAGLTMVAEAAARMTLALGPEGHSPGEAFGLCLIEVEEALRAADPIQ